MNLSAEVVTSDACGHGRERLALWSQAFSERPLARKVAADELIELGDGEFVEAVGGAVDQSLLDQPGAGGGDALGTWAADGVGGRSDVVVRMSCSLVSAMRTLLLRRFDRR
jgi:hypothetical protein